MYIIISCLLKTVEISHRSTYKTRLAARKNLQKEAQNWILQTKPNNEWEVITHKKDATTKTKYFIKTSNKNEDLLSIYERVENVQKGWIYNSTNVQLVKLITFSVLDITSENDEAIPETRYLSTPIVEKAVLTDSDRIVLNCQKQLLSELTTNLAKRRQVIEKKE